MSNVLTPVLFALQVFTLTSWYVVPIFWLPIATFLFFRSAAQFSAVPGAFLPVLKTNPLDTLATLNPVTNSISEIAYARTFACFLTGNIIWTLLEYTLHRFLFHIDAWLPDKPVFLTIHFLLHGVHHYLPMDRYDAILNASPSLLTTRGKISPRDAATALHVPLVPVHAPRLRALPHSRS